MNRFEDKVVLVTGGSASCSAQILYRNNALVGDIQFFQRLAQIAERCPVHKTLAHGVEFDDNATFGPTSQS